MRLLRGEREECEYKDVELRFLMAFLEGVASIVAGGFNDDAELELDSTRLGAVFSSVGAFDGIGFDTARFFRRDILIIVAFVSECLRTGVALTSTGGLSVGVIGFPFPFDLLDARGLGVGPGKLSKLADQSFPLGNGGTGGISSSCVTSKSLLCVDVEDKVLSRGLL